MINPRSLEWKFIFLPGLALSLGWGLRGQVGHCDGAMISGILVALALCVLLPGKQFSRGLVAGLGAIAFGYGATMTTQDTADLALRWIQSPDGYSLHRDFIGLAIKGFVWAMMGGIFIGLGFAASHYRWKDIVLGMFLMIATFPLGWALINKPRPVFFSVTRHEIFGGFIVGGAVLLTWLTIRGRTKIPLIVSLCAGAGGAIGLPMGAFLGGIGSHTSYVGHWYDWWKVLETTFGAFMGMGLGIGIYLIRHQLPEATVARPLQYAFPSRWQSAALGLLMCGLFLPAENNPWDDWLVLGSLMVCAAFYFPKVVGWHIGITVTYFAIAANVVTYWTTELHMGNAIFLWVAVCVTSAAVSWCAAGWSNDEETPIHIPFLFVVWAIVSLTTVRGFIIPAVFHPSVQAVADAGGRALYTLKTWAGAFVVQVVLALMASLLTFATLSLDRPFKRSIPS